MSISPNQFKEAAWQADLATVQHYIEQGGDIHACGSNGVGALVSFDIEILDYLFSQGIDPAMVWADGSPAIGFHAWEVNIDTLGWFLDKGVDPNAENLHTGENCLHNLCAKPTLLEKRLQGIRLLLDAGIDVNRKTRNGVETGSYMRDVKVVGETALHRAAAYQSKQTIELLLGSGADKSLLDDRGESPLSWASRHWRDRSILKLLLYGTYQNSIT